MVGFRKSYEEYYKKTHEEDWTGNIVDKYYMFDLKESIE
jgi:hypothetical protein